MPASGWICPIMPWGFHSSPWQSFSLNCPTFLPWSVHHKPHQDLLARWYMVLVNIPVLGGTEIACCHLHRCTGRQSSSGRGGVIAEGRLPLSVRRVGAPSGMHRLSCFSRQNCHHKTPISSHCSGLSSHVISKKERRNIHTVLHCVHLPASCW